MFPKNSRGLRSSIPQRFHHIKKLKGERSICLVEHSSRTRRAHSSGSAAQGRKDPSGQGTIISAGFVAHRDGELSKHPRVPPAQGRVLPSLQWMRVGAPTRASWQSVGEWSTHPCVPAGHG